MITLNKRYLNQLWIILIALLFLAPSIFGIKTSDETLSLNSAIVHTKAPNNTQFSIFALTITNLTATQKNIEQITVQSQSSTTKFGQGISQIEIYQDSNENSAFETSDQRLASESLSSQSLQTLNLSFTNKPLLTSIGSDIRLFVVMTLDADATINTTANVTMTKLNNLTLLDDDDQVTTIGNSVTISGLNTYSITDISNSLALPGQKLIPMLKISLQMLGETADTKKTVITIKNDSNNFITESNQTNGIIAAYLKLDSTGTDSGLDQFTEENIEGLQTIDTVIPTNSSTLIFDEINASLPEATTVNLLLVYDLGATVAVTTNSLIKAQVSQLTTLGNQSKLTITKSTSQPSTPAESNIGGLSYSELTSIVPVKSTFGKSSTIPMLRFGLQANHTEVDITKFLLQNNGSINFRTNLDSPTNVTKIYLYEDTDTDSDFDGVNSSNDTLIASLNLGTGSNESTRANLVVDNNGSSSLTLSTFESENAEGYPQNNIKKFFIIYDVGSNLNPGTSSGKTVKASLENTIGNVAIQQKTTTVNLSGTLPVSSSPTASVTLETTNVYINSITDISPTTGLQGQIKIPMLNIILTADENVSSSSMEIQNNQNTYNTNNDGVSKVWIFKDIDQNGAFAPDIDTPISTLSNLANVETATLSGLPLSQGNNHLLLLYDIGHITTLSTNGIQAQLKGMVGGNGSTITFGGELPNPTSPSSISIEKKQVSISSIETNADSNTNLTEEFNIDIYLQNTHTSDINITNISPRFYLSSIGGADITSQFSFATSTTNFTLSQGSELKKVSFTVSKNARSSEGAVYIDSYVEYAIATNSPGTLERYQQNSIWFSTLSGTSNSDPPRLNITNTETTYSWNIPSYIKELYTVAGNQDTPFSNGDATPLNSGLKIVLTNSGLTIDEGSLKISVNGTEVSRTSSISGQSIFTSSIKLFAQSSLYTYNANTGTIEIDNLGEISGTVMLELNDTSGQPLETASISFEINSKIELSDSLFYPNPFQIGSEDLILGYNITTPATVRVYIYDLYGSLIHEKTITHTSLGYQTYTINKSAGFLQSGSYLVRIYAKDSNGNEARQFTRLGIY